MILGLGLESLWEDSPKFSSLCVSKDPGWSPKTCISRNFNANVAGPGPPLPTPLLSAWAGCAFLPPVPWGWVFFSICLAFWTVSMEKNDKCSSKTWSLVCQGDLCLLGQREVKMGQVGDCQEWVCGHKERKPTSDGGRTLGVGTGGCPLQSSTGGSTVFSGVPETQILGL